MAQFNAESASFHTAASTPFESAAPETHAAYCVPAACRT
jgi:hypothetical protein